MPGSFGSRMLRKRLRGNNMIGFARTVMIRPFGKGFIGLGIPLVSALIRDLRQPDGHLRMLYRRIREKKPSIRVIDADYERIEDSRKIVEKINNDSSGKED